MSTDDTALSVFSLLMSLERYIPFASLVFQIIH